jgi:hypothetical protein
MADEATLVYELEPPVPFVVADATALEKGALLKLADLMVVAGATADNDVFAGIAAQEKVANDGRTKTAVYLRGIFKLTIAAGNTTTVGQDVVIKGTNQVGGYTTLDDEKGYKVGKALETGAAGETVLVLVSV